MGFSWEYGLRFFYIGLWMVVMPADRPRLPLGLTPRLHFVGFKDDRIWNARQIWGEPDFYHRIYDRRARQEIVPGDTAVFATGSIDDPPKPIAWDDSQQDILARGGKEFFL